MTKWILQCENCKREWVLEVSFNLSDMEKIYHYCPHCKKNTYNKILRKEDDEKKGPDT